jgi:hypothetical protein
MSNNSMAKIYDKVKFFDKVKILPGGISNSPTYALQRNVSAISGGGSEITFTVNTTNVADGTSLPYTITGISQEDVISGDLTGSFTVASNTASTTLEVSLEPTSPEVSSASLVLDNGLFALSNGWNGSYYILNGSQTSLNSFGTGTWNNQVYLNGSSSIETAVQTLSGLQLWLNADDTNSVKINQTSGQPTQLCWIDKSPNALSAISQHSTTMPVASTAAVNGKNAIVFDGSNDYLALSNPINVGATNWTHFAVYTRPLTGITSQTLGHAGTGTDNTSCLWHARADYGRNANLIYSGNRSTDFPILSTGTLVVAIQKNKKLFIGTQVVGISSQPFPWYQDNMARYIGLVEAKTPSDGVGSPRYHTGALCEIIHYNGYLTDQETLAIKAQLEDKWLGFHYPTT